MSEARSIPHGNFEQAEPGSKGSRLADVVKLPRPEPIYGEAANQPDTPNTLPATTLERETVRDLLLSGQDADTDQRVSALLDYAWRSSSHVERAVPSELLAHVKESPTEWYASNLHRVDGLLREREQLAQIYEDTDTYEDCPFLRNTAVINEMAWDRGKGSEALKVELSSRLIILDAMTARQQT